MGAFDSLRASLGGDDELNGMVVDPATNQLVPARAAAPSVGYAAPVPAFRPPDSMPLPPGAASTDETGTVTGKPTVDEVAKARAELLAAQAKSNRDAYTSHVGAMLDDAGSIIRGEHPNTSATAARGEALAKAPEQNILTARAQDAEQEAIAARKAANDEDSLPSQRATMLAQAQQLIPPGKKITLAQYQEMIEGAKVNASKEEAKGKLLQGEASLKQTAQAEHDAHLDRMAQVAATMKEAAARLGQDKNNNDALNAYRNAELELKRLEAGQKEREKEAGKGRIPAEEAAKLAKLESATKALDDLEKLHGEKASGTLAGIAQVLPGSDAAEYKRAMLPYAENIKTAFQDRENPAAAQQVDSMLPTPGLPNDAAKAQFGHMRELIANKRAAIHAGLEAAGYRPNLGGGTGATVKETRILPDGRTIELLSDGTKRLKQ